MNERILEGAAICAKLSGLLGYRVDVATGTVFDDKNGNELLCATRGMDAEYNLEAIQDDQALNGKSMEDELVETIALEIAASKERISHLWQIIGTVTCDAMTFQPMLKLKVRGVFIET